MDRVECVGDPALDERYPASWPAWVQVTTTRGERFRAEAEHPRGDPDNPLTEAELTAKFDDLTGHCYDPGRRSALRDAVASLPEGAGLEAIMTLA
jgi:2-methylcitrate dehydratase PrpD